MIELRSFLLATALVLTLGACTSEVSKEPATSGAGDGATPVGSWSCDTEQAVAQWEARFEEDMAETPESQRAMARSRLEPLLAGIRGMHPLLEIQADNTFTLDSTNPDGTKERVLGTWRMDGDKVLMTGRIEGQDGEQTIVGRLDGDKIVCERGEGARAMQLIFSRK